MSEDRKFVIRCRAIILHEGKLLLVRHPKDMSYAALPGGKLEWGEGVMECMKREIVEELGVEPELGRLLYVNTFVDSENSQSVEFFFEVKNGNQYSDVKKLKGAHAHELAEIIWATPADDVRILPEELGKNFNEGKIVPKETRYMKS
jgi:ADP-ribose pyrophosphatase YjhB (NUDIX family)